METGPGLEGTPLCSHALFDGLQNGVQTLSRRGACPEGLWSQKGL